MREAHEGGTPERISFWIASTPETEYPQLSGDVVVDVAVLGGGITGLTAAALLKRAGRKVAVVEAKRIVGGATGYTTAKLTAGHSLVYARLERDFGAEGARLYAQANTAAIELVQRLVAEHGIDCDLEPRANFVYAETADEDDRVKEEAEAARRAGLPASYVRETPLPYAARGAVRLDDQAQFHPRKYLLALARTIPGDGSHLFELTRALDADEGDPCLVQTTGGTVRADDVIVATHLPFLDRGLFFAKAHPSRSYAVAAPIDAAGAPDGMFINVGQPTRSVRTIRDGERVLLQVGGEGHRAGWASDTPVRYARLEEFLRMHWDAGPVEYTWSTMDYVSVDRVPYVGPLRRGSRNLHVATGFGKWGMSGGTAAAILLADLIQGRENPAYALYRSRRLNLRAGYARLVKENGLAGMRFAADRLKGLRGRSLDELGAGEGALIRRRGRLTAVYRDGAGELHTLSPACTHLRCVVAWNTAERTWDCPCHGSRFTGEGHVVHGPATSDLPPRRSPGLD